MTIADWRPANVPLRCCLMINVFMQKPAARQVMHAPHMSVSVNSALGHSFFYSSAAVKVGSNETLLAVQYMEYLEVGVKRSPLRTRVLFSEGRIYRVPQKSLIHQWRRNRMWIPGRWTAA